MALSGTSSSSANGSSSSVEALLAEFSSSSGSSSDLGSVLSGLLGSPASSSYSASGTLNPTQAETSNLFSELA